MPSTVANTTLQATVLSATSNVLAQTIQSYRHDLPFAIDVVQVARFSLCTILLTPPNVRWQSFLENKFPASQPPNLGVKKEDHEKSDPAQLKRRNTLIKWALDMTLGAAMNTLFFIVVIGALKGLNRLEIFEALNKDFFPLIVAGMKLWPLVSILSFTFVPVERRVLVGSIVGLFWNIYLSILAA